MWGPFARRVSGRELIAFDAPGTGLSQRPRGPLRMSALAGIVRELMDELALERADVLGYSFGGPPRAVPHLPLRLHVHCRVPGAIPAGPGAPDERLLQG
jgi:alpha-beta hydrolase superfamily lysophospholipase